MSLLMPDEIGIYTLPTNVEFTDKPLRNREGKLLLNRQIVIGNRNFIAYTEAIKGYKRVLDVVGISNTTDMSIAVSPYAKRNVDKINRIVRETGDYLYEMKNYGICSPLSIGYLASNLNSDKNFAIYIDINKDGGIIPKNMIAWRFVGSHIHVIAFCTNNTIKGGGGRLITILKETCITSNIPCVSLYALSKAESYYLLQGFIILTDGSGNIITDDEGHKAMIWYNPSFNLDIYRTSGLYEMRKLNVPNYDKKLNNAINTQLGAIHVVQDWMELASYSILSQELTEDDQAIVNDIEASPEIANSQTILDYIENTRPYQFEIMNNNVETQPSIQKSMKRSRDSGEESSEGEEEDIYGETRTTGPGGQISWKRSKRSKDIEGGSRRRKRPKKISRRKATRKNKKVKIL